MTDHPIFLGARASLLLGLLGRPMTVDELEILTNEVLVRYDDLIPPELPTFEEGRVAIRAIAEGGPAEIERLLCRMLEFGFVRREGDVWSRLPTPAWPRV